MITNEEAMEKVHEHEEKVRQLHIVELNKIKQDTIKMCNESLSQAITFAAQSGRRYECVNTACIGGEEEDCATLLMRNQNYSWEQQKTQIHIPTLISYIQAHNFSISESEELYRTGKDSRNKIIWTHGKMYTIRWA